MAEYLPAKQVFKQHCPAIQCGERINGSDFNRNGPGKPTRKT
jgi:hypothetical protein